MSQNSDLKVYSNVIEQLTVHSILYSILEHAPVNTMEEAAKVCENKPEEGVKVLFARTYTTKKKYNYCLVVWTGNKQVDFNQLAALFSIKKVKLASPEEVSRYLDLEIGALSPFGYKTNFPIIIDRDLLEQEMLFINPGIHSKTIRIKPTDLKLMIRKSTTSSIHFI